MASLISKARKPKFELHLKIYDLNNVPLVSGVSLIKWHLEHSIHSDQRGRTQKCPIANHRVEYNYSKVVPLRIAIDRNGNLAECPIEFEVLQEFSPTGTVAGVTGRDEKISLGIVKLNLSEYVEESEAILREDSSTLPALRASFTSPGPGDKPWHQRQRSSLSSSAFLEPDASPRSSHPPSELEEERPAADVQDGVVRRYLMQESKINSTLKISILMIQTDGERNYVAPPLKTAPVFGGIAGFVSGDALEPVDASVEAAGQVPSLSTKSRDVFEMQDMYRRALAASWASQPGEVSADQCIEDIFAGGDGFHTASSTSHRSSNSRSQSNTRRPPSSPRHDRTGGEPTGITTPSTSSSGGGGGASLRREGSGSTSGDDDMMGTLRPRDMARMRLRLRGDSTASDRSSGTVLGDSHRNYRDSGGSRIGGGGSHRDLPQMMMHHHSIHRRDGSKGSDSGLRSRSDSAASLATTLGSDRGRDGFKRAREVDEFEVRDDLVAWAVQGVQT